MKRLANALSLALFCCLVAGSASAAEIRVLVTNAFKSVIGKIEPSFKSSTGHSLSVRAAASPVLQEEIAKGDNFDVVILITSNLDALEKAEKTASDTRTNIARAGLGLAVRAGQPKPDIRTSDAFKQALVNAKSVAYVTAGASGKHLIAVAERLGIADQLKAKGKTLPTGNVAEFVANGEAELAIQQMSELMAVKGVDVVGELPADVDLISQIAAAMSANAKEPEAGKAFIRFLTTADAGTTIRASGMMPD
jgi:molybdate transport system substrate-binding protein